MKSPIAFFPLAALVAVAAVGQGLECPASSSSRCDAFHYHVQMYRPDTRQFVEVWGVNQFASQAACDRAREAHLKRNLTVVDYFRKVRNETKYEPDRFGTCHCDTTGDKASPRFLSDAQRAAQIRLAEEVRGYVRERLLDEQATTDSEAYRSVAPPPAQPSPLVSGPRLVPLPSATPSAQVAASPDDLKQTKAVDLAKKPAVASLDMPLAEIPLPGEEPPSGDTPLITEDVAVEDDEFIAVETERVQSVLQASSNIADDNLKAKVFETCRQRVQLLSNLRTLIDASGVKSRLAAGARAAKAEDQRVAFIAKLFGDEVAPHWAPPNVEAVVLPPRPEIDSDPERVLRDTSGRYAAPAKKRALYMMLAQSQPTDEQQLWLTSVIEGFLQ